MLYDNINKQVMSEGDAVYTVIAVAVAKTACWNIAVIPHDGTETMRSRVISLADDPMVQVQNWINQKETGSFDRYAALADMK